MKVPEICPRCGAEIKQEIIELKKGGFIYLEKCAKDGIHYYHMRRPTWKEIESWN